MAENNDKLSKLSETDSYKNPYIGAVSSQASELEQE